VYRNAVIVSSVRTPIGSFRGTLKDKTAIELAALVIRSLIEHTGRDFESVEEVYMSCVGQYGIVCLCIGGGQGMAAIYKFL
jgi:acetyl-CoA C-acetyltransferase